MITLSDDAKAALVLTTRLGDAERPSLTPKAWHRLTEMLRLAGKSPAAVFDGSADLSETMARQVEELLASGAQVTIDLETQLQKGIWVLTQFDDGYPTRFRRLGDVAPPVIFGAGNPSLLEAGGVGIVGSRDVTEAGAEVASQLAQETVRLGKVVVSGGARGVDQLATDAAIGAGGRVVAVLPDALDRRIRSSDVLRALDDDAVCLLTQQHPSAGFSAAAAFGRNKLIYASADLTVVVASADSDGGTWQGAAEAMRLGLPVAVWRGHGEGPGNGRLEGMGALALKSIGDLGPALSSAPDRRAPEQLTIL